MGVVELESTHSFRPYAHTSYGDLSSSRQAPCIPSHSPREPQRLTAYAVLSRGSRSFLGKCLHIGPPSSVDGGAGVVPSSTVMSYLVGEGPWTRKKQSDILPPP